MFERWGRWRSVGGGGAGRVEVGDRVLLVVLEGGRGVVGVGGARGCG